MDEWISVKKDLPKNSRSVFILEMDAINDYAFPYRYEDAVEKGFYENGQWFYEWWDDDRYEKAEKHKAGDFKANDVTHWMPLPEPPKEEK